MRRAAAFVLFLLLSAGCSEPPQKEIDQAQGAFDAAKAAGADKYAPDEYSAAASSLQKAHDAVDQRDYRQALSYAIDARERAQEAARASADGKAQARGAAEKALSDAQHAADDLDASLKAPEIARLPAKDLRGPRETLGAVRKSLQEARAQIDGGHYAEASATVTDVRGKIDAASKEVEGLRVRRPTGPRRGSLPSR
jgi:hypothetical protein